MNDIKYLKEINEYKVISFKRLFDKFNPKYTIYSIFERNNAVYIISKDRIIEKDDSIEFINLTIDEYKEDKTSLCYLKHYTDNIIKLDDFVQKIETVNYLYPLNIYNINGRKICIELFNTFFNLSINGFSFLTFNKMNKFDDKFVYIIKDIIRKEFENAKYL